MVAESTTGTFIFSWDFELAWGFHDRDTLPFRLREYDSRTYLYKLIDILEETGIPSTWATVGHLFLDSCQQGDKRPHSSLPVPNADWYQKDPLSNYNEDPLWYAPDIINCLSTCSTNQEIGCHTFSHVTGHADSDIIYKELEKCNEMAPQNVELESFVPPRHVPVPNQILAELDFTSYRSDTNSNGLLRPLKFYSGVSHPPIVTPQVDPSGLVKMPSSTFFFYQPFNHYQQKFPSIKRRWFKRGVDKAASSGGTFHIWAHPHNFFGNDVEISTFQWLMEYVSTRIENNDLRAMTMGEYATSLMKKNEH